MSAVALGLQSRFASVPAGWPVQDAGALPRSIADLERYARALLFITPDGSVGRFVHPSPVLHTIAVLDATGALALELGYRRHRPYGKQHIGKKGSPRLLISQRTPTGTLSADELALVLPLLASTVQETVDLAVRTGYVGRTRTIRLDDEEGDAPMTVRAYVPAQPWRSTTHCVTGTRLTGGRSLRNPGSFRGPVTLERGTLWRVADRDSALLDAFWLQANAPQPRFEKALAHAARIVGSIASYRRESLRRQKLQAFRRTGSNARWLREPCLLNVLQRLGRHDAQRTLMDLVELRALPTDALHRFWSRLAVREDAPPLPLGTLRVRERPPGKDHRKGYHVFEVLPSAPFRNSRPRFFVPIDAPQYVDLPEDVSAAAVPF